MVFLPGVMLKNMKVNLKMATELEKVSILLKVELFMKEITKKTLLQGLDR